jgi:condensin-2 complex subunit H2
LEEYLQELVGLPSLDQPQSSDHPQQEGSTTAPNFAHAALILQNSSNVYSRKVEYLHGLVYKALYEFFKTTSANSTKESRRKSADSAIEEFFDFDPHVDFLLLDNVVPEDLTNHKINLKEDDDDDEIETELGGSTPNQSLTRTRISLGGLSVTRAEQRSSIGGFASSSQQRALLGTLNNGSLRLVDGRCDVGDDGVLLMPGSSSAPSITMVDPASGGRRSLFGDEAVPMNLPQNDDYDDHSNDGPGFEFHDDHDDNDNDPEPVGVEEEVATSSVVAVALQQQAPRKKVAFQEPKKRIDPWALLDPHSSENATQKPLRKGKTYRLPPGIDLPPSDCVTGASTRRMPQRRPPPARQEVRLCLAAETFRALLRNQWQPPKIPINGLVFGDEFAYIAKETAKKRAVLRRAERKRQQQEQAQPYDEHDVYEEDEDDYGGGYDFGGEDDDDDDNNDIGNAGMTSLDDAFQNATDSQGEYKKMSVDLLNLFPCSQSPLLKMLPSPTWARRLKSFVARIFKPLPRAPTILP